MRVADISNYDYDQDITNPDGWIPALKAEGIEGVIIGSQWMDKARWQLAKCKAQGMPVIATYAEPDVETAIQLAKEAGCSTVCIVVEPGGIQDAHQLELGCGTVRTAGMAPILYGNRGDILATAGTDTFKAFPLWFASYFDDKHIVRSVDFWPTLWGHQFTSTWMIAGKNRDVSEIFGLEEFSVDDKARLARLEGIVISVFDAVPRPGTEHLFPDGTPIVPEGVELSRDQWVRLTGENALEYARIRGFSLALAIENK